LKGCGKKQNTEEQSLVSEESKKRCVARRKEGLPVRFFVVWFCEVRGSQSEGFHFSHFGATNPLKNCLHIVNIFRRADPRKIQPPTACLA
jgi:hypothetical protein